MKRIPNLRRIVVLLDADTLKDIDEVRFRRRFLSRMEAIRALLRNAIDRELGKKTKKGE
jgi:metal-responsive CopG/Arc/MetJ family transcriptional regulator